MRDSREPRETKVVAMDQGPLAGEIGPGYIQSEGVG